MIREILEYTVPEWDGMHHLHLPWLWVSRLGSVCSNFLRAVKEIALSRPCDAERDPGLGLPRKMCLENGSDDDDYDRDSFVKSFIAAPWKASRLEELSVTALPSDSSFSSALDLLLSTPGLFPSVTMLMLRGEVNKRMLLGIPIAFPSLDSLDLGHCCLETGKLNNASQEFGIFGRSFFRPLACIFVTNTRWITCEHFAAFLPHHRERLSRLHLEHVRFSDQTLTLLESFHELRDLNLSTSNNAVSGEALESFLRVRGRSLVKLGLPPCPDLDSRVIDILIQHVPNLDSLRLNSAATWILPESLERLIRGWKPHWLDTQRSHFKLSVFYPFAREDEERLVSLALPVELEVAMT